MQACSESASLPRLESGPEWTIRVARPATADRNELARELRGVPKAALGLVFGKVLATRLWQQHRAADPARVEAAPGTAIFRNALAGASKATTAPSDTNSAAAALTSKSIIELDRVSDAEISGGMLRYLCAEAAATLRDCKRLAKSIVLTVQYSNGESETVEHLLPQAANEAGGLETAARLALRGMRSNAFVSLRLDVTATTAPCVLAHADSAKHHAPLTCVA